MYPTVSSYHPQRQSKSSVTRKPPRAPHIIIPRLLMLSSERCQGGASDRPKTRLDRPNRPIKSTSQLQIRLAAAFALSSFSWSSASCSKILPCHLLKTVVLRAIRSRGSCDQRRHAVQFEEIIVRISDSAVFRKSYGPFAIFGSAHCGPLDKTFTFVIVISFFLSFFWASYPFTILLHLSISFPFSSPSQPCPCCASTFAFSFSVNRLFLPIVAHTQKAGTGINSALVVSGTNTVSIY